MCCNHRSARDCRRLPMTEREPSPTSCQLWGTIRLTLRSARASRLMFGDKLSIRLTSANDGYVTLFDLNSENELTLLFPTQTDFREGISNEIRAHRPLIVPNELHGFTFTARDPIGPGRAIAIVTEDRVGFRPSAGAASQLQFNRQQAAPHEIHLRAPVRRVDRGRREQGRSMGRRLRRLRYKQVISALPANRDANRRRSRSVRNHGLRVHSEREEVGGGEMNTRFKPFALVAAWMFSAMFACGSSAALVRVLEHPGAGTVIAYAAEPGGLAYDGPDGRPQSVCRSAASIHRSSDGRGIDASLGPRRRARIDFRGTEANGARLTARPQPLSRREPGAASVQAPARRWGPAGGGTHAGRAYNRQ